MKKFAIILSGCGVYDGAEIHEATLCMLAIKQAGHQYQIFAPNINQYHVINHLTGEVTNETRNVLVESARIARGQAKDLKEYSANDYDAIVIPGGFGAAKNLSDYAFKAANCTINNDVEKAIKGTYAAKKPIGAMCISPVIIAKVLGDKVEVTAGDKNDTMPEVEKMGAIYIPTTHGEVISDLKHKVFTTPCYMLDADIAQIAEGANNLIKIILKSL